MMIRSSVMLASLLIACGGTTEPIQTSATNTSSDEQARSSLAELPMIDGRPVHNVPVVMMEAARERVWNSYEARPRIPKFDPAKDTRRSYLFGEASASHAKSFAAHLKSQEADFQQLASSSSRVDRFFFGVVSLEYLWELRHEVLSMPEDAQPDEEVSVAAVEEGSAADAPSMIRNFETTLELARKLGAPFDVWIPVLEGRRQAEIDLLARVKARQAAQ